MPVAPEAGSEVGTGENTMSVEHVTDVDESTVEIFYRCRRCHRSWTRSFDVRRWFEDDGGLVEVFRRDGVPVPSPRSGPRCVFCDGLRVDWSETPFTRTDTDTEPVPPTARPTLSAKPGRPRRARFDYPDFRMGFPFMVPLRPQLRPRTYRFP